MCKAVIYSPCSPALGATVRTYNCSSMRMGWQVWTGLSLLIPWESLVYWRWCWPWVALFKNLFFGWVATLLAHLTSDFERCIFIIVVVIIYFKSLPAMRGWLSSHSFNGLPKLQFNYLRLFFFQIFLHFNFLICLFSLLLLWEQE